MSSPFEEADLRNSVVLATCPINKPPLPHHHTPHQHMPRHHLTIIFRHIHIWALIVCSTDFKCCHGNMSCQQTTTTVCDIYRFPLKIWGRLLQMLSHYISDMDIYWIGYLTGISIYGDSQDQSAVQENTVQWSLTYCSSRRLVCTLHLWYGHLLDI